ncbi:MAG: hypothetical protein ACOY93_00160 [Bacillota bacterium]
MTANALPTVAEQVQLATLLQSEAVALRKIQAMQPVISDPELRQQVQTCIQTGKNHLTALMSFGKEHRLIQ